MRSSLVALICCLLVVALVGATAVSAAPSTAGPGSANVATAGVADDAMLSTAAVSEDAPRYGSVPGDSGAAVAASETNESLQSEQEDNGTQAESIEIAIDADGDAHFVLAKEFPAETGPEQRAFDQVASEYERGEHGDLGFPAYEAIFEDVSEETNRSMELIDDGRHTSREDGVGRLEYRFTWTNFGTVENSEVTIGDAFTTDGDVWLELHEGQRLSISAPDGYSVTASPSGPEIEDGTLIWTGPTSFGPGDLDVTFGESSGEFSTLPTTVLWLGIGVLIAALLVGAWRLADRRSGDGSAPSLPTREALADAVSSTVSDLGIGESESSDHGAGPSSDSADVASEKAGAATDAEPSAAPEPAGATGESIDPELLSDEERVEHMLEENGGRMKQATIVTETGWSNAKVSQLLSQMAEDDRVDKLRIGRENLISLPDVDVTDQDQADS